MITSLKGHPDTFSSAERERICRIAKEHFIMGSKIIEDEEILHDLDLENQIKEKLKSVSGLRMKSEESNLP